MNSVNLIGRLTADPVLKQTTNKKSVCSFSLAVDRYKDDVDFIDCVAWEKTAEAIADYLTRGRQIGITGELRTRTYKDKKGSTHKVVEVLVNNFTFCGRKSDVEEPELKPAKLEPVEDYDMDLPF